MTRPTTIMVPADCRRRPGHRWVQRSFDGNRVDPSTTFAPVVGVPVVPSKRPEDHVRILIGDGPNPAGTARHAVADECRGRVPDAAIDDLQIVVSELVANTVEHGGGADGLTVDLTFLAGHVRLRVTGHGDRHLMPPVEQWVLPVPTQRTGRGLALVRHLAGDVTIAGEDAVPGESGWVVITAAVPFT